MNKGVKAQTLFLSDNKTLDDYVLGKEMMEFAKLSSNAFRYWKETQCATYESSSIVFLKKSTIPKKYKTYIELCTELKGLVQSTAFCRYTGLSPSLLVQSNKSAFKNYIKIVKIGRCKLVDLHHFYRQFNLPLHYYIYVDKCKNFSALEKKISITKSLCLGYY